VAKSGSGAALKDKEYKMTSPFPELDGHDDVSYLWNYQPQPVLGQNLKSFQFGFDLQLCTNTLPFSTNLNQFNEALDSESLFRQNLQLGMPVYSNTLGQTNMPVGPGNGLPTTTGQTANEHRPQHQMQKRRLRKKASSVSDDTSDLFRMDAGLGHPDDTFLVRVSVC